MQNLRDELAEYVPAGSREREMSAAFLAFLDAYDGSCFERTLALGHVTGSAWVVDTTGSWVLLNHHRKLGKWLQFGGHADGDRDIRRVALREAREESGIEALAFAIPGIYDVDVHRIPARGAEPEHLHYDVRFALFANRSAQPVASAESHDVRWIALDELTSLPVDDSVRRLAAKTINLPLCKDSV